MFNIKAIYITVLLEGFAQASAFSISVLYGEAKTFLSNPLR